MLTEEDWLFRPVHQGFFPATALIDGSIDLAFVAVCNDAIDVMIENDRRAAEAERRELDG